MLLLGIDGGGTSCRARLCALSGEVLGEAATGPANLRLGLGAKLFRDRGRRHANARPSRSFERHLTRVVACLALAGASEPSLPRRRAELSAPLPQSHRHHRRACRLSRCPRPTRRRRHRCGHRHRWLGGRYEGRHTGSAAGACRFRMKAAAPGSGAKRCAGCCGRSTAASHGPGCCARSAAEFGNDPHFIVRWADTASPRDFGSLRTAHFRLRRSWRPVAVEMAETCCPPYRCTRGAARRSWRGAAGAGRWLCAIPAKLSR